MNEYKYYSVQDFDKDNCLKIAKIFYITLLFILRGYIVWLMSVTNMRDKVEIIAWIYPDTSMFIMSLISGSLGIFVVVLILLRRPEAASWVKRCWPYSRVFLVIALLFDLTISFIGYLYWQLLTIQSLAIQGALAILLIVLCFKNKKLKINLKEFPEILIADKKK